ncbi:MAG TPA: glycerol-3-phosphate dehydrogenase/oxidase [Candidatus Obscuribacterales bacterium]
MITKDIVRPSLQELSGRKFDVIVIGGGITGAGVAQDSASRGLSTLLVEKGDFASGTSSKSTKLIHGGLRYLQNFQFGVVLESVRERQVQLKLAPHMVHSLPFVIPAYGKNWFNNRKWELGLWVYDCMAGLSGNRFHKRISRQEVIDLCPGIRQEGLVGGLLYYDCRTDDARHTLEVIKSACEHGCVAVNYARVSSLVRENGRVVGVELIDESPTASGAVARVCGRVVVNATGVWTQKTAELGGGKASVAVSPAKGVHITLAPERLPIKSAMLIPTGADGRFCFAVPWYDSIIVGTTDTPYNGDLDRIATEEEEVEYILAAVNEQFPQARVTSADVTGKFAGLRPLIRDAKAKGTTKVSRKHTLEHSRDGLVTIAGGKLTTYRPMAKETVDLVVKILNRSGRFCGPCITGELMLGGWASDIVRPAFVKALQKRAAALGLGDKTVETLERMYGQRACSLIQMAMSDRSLAEPLVEGHTYIKAQLVYAVESEAALTLEDALSRRIRLAITDSQGARQIAESASQTMARLLGWTEELRKAQVEAFLAGLDC